MNAPNVWGAIEHALKTPALAAIAQKKFAEQAQHLFKPHKIELSASAAGACVLEKWASLHGELDLPEDYAQMAVKMDGGTLYGARLAALFAAGWESKYTEHGVATEVVGEHDGIPGHVEIVIHEGNEALWMIEIKTSFWGGVVSEHPRTKHSKEFHIIQAAKEALIVGAPGFSVLNVLPAATKRNGEKARHFIQDDFETSAYTLAVQVEYGRLQRALGASAPTGDATEPWRCSSCRYSACERNKNPLNMATA